MYGRDKMSYDTPITGEVSGPGQEHLIPFLLGCQMESLF